MKQAFNLFKDIEEKVLFEELYYTLKDTKFEKCNPFCFFILTEIHEELGPNTTVTFEDFQVLLQKYTS